MSRKGVAKGDSFFHYYPLTSLGTVAALRAARGKTSIRAGVFTMVLLFWNHDLKAARAAATAF
jgi:hypothetical protein